MCREEINIFKNICIELFIMTDPKYHFKNL